MGSIKMFGFTALAALMAMAFVGAGSAMAENTALCEEDVAGACPPGKLITHIHRLSRTTTRTRIRSSIIVTSCHLLRLSITITNHGPRVVETGNNTYSECETESGSACTVAEVNPESTVEIEKLGHELGDITYSIEFNVHCGSFINCTYNGVGLQGHALGPLLAEEENGEERLEEQVLNKTGGLFCPKSAKLELLTTPLTRAYLTE